MESQRLEPLLAGDDLSFAKRCNLAVTHGFNSFFELRIPNLPLVKATSRLWVHGAGVAHNRRRSSLDAPAETGINEGTHVVCHLIPLLEKGVVTVRRVELVVLDIFAKLT
jgi:hypothetical protein